MPKLRLIQNPSIKILQMQKTKKLYPMHSMQSSFISFFCIALSNRYPKINLSSKKMKDMETNHTLEFALTKISDLVEKLAVESTEDIA